MSTKTIHFLLPKRKLAIAKRTKRSIYMKHTEYSVVFEATQAAQTEPGLDALPKASMGWLDSLQAVLLVLRATKDADDDALAHNASSRATFSGSTPIIAFKLSRIIEEVVQDHLRLLTSFALSICTYSVIDLPQNLTRW
jgi:hypothetical protein